MELFKLTLKQLTGGGVAENLAGHIVYLGGGMVTVCLCDFAQGFALGEEAALNAGPFGWALMMGWTRGGKSS